MIIILPQKIHKKLNFSHLFQHQENHNAATRTTKNFNIFPQFKLIGIIKKKAHNHCHFLTDLKENNKNYKNDNDDVYSCPCVVIAE